MSQAPHLISGALTSALCLLTLATACGSSRSTPPSSDHAHHAHHPASSKHLGLKSSLSYASLFKDRASEFTDAQLNQCVDFKRKITRDHPNDPLEPSSTSLYRFMGYERGREVIYLERDLSPESQARLGRSEDPPLISAEPLQSPPSEVMIPAQFIGEAGRFLALSSMMSGRRPEDEKEVMRRGVGVYFGRAQSKMETIDHTLSQVRVTHGQFIIDGVDCTVKNKHFTLLLDQRYESPFDRAFHQYHPNSFISEHDNTAFRGRFLFTQAQGEDGGYVARLIREIIVSEDQEESILTQEVECRSSSQIWMEALNIHWTYRCLEGWVGVKAVLAHE